ncbi:DUF177 domain-containing protein [Ruminococcaceae bacterium OttesenSCG-928-L11]|nr:DUF177 domain-containing protein [Ruminococcaceae bacterium OttesenSCG-928-L11]
MLINVKQLETGGFSREKSLDFAESLDMSGVKQWGYAPFQQPVRVQGSVASHLGILTVAYTAEYQREDPCARCLEPVRTEESRQFSHILMDSAHRDIHGDREDEPPDEDDDAYIYIDDGVLHLDELVIADLLLDLERVVLCKPDCQGLCPQCGINRNETTCACSTREPDPRFAALREHLEQS